MLSKEELLKPRFKVIADYPGSDYHIGEILDRDWGWCGNDEIGFKHSISQYPHLFKELKWWEGRSESDFPEYLKVSIDYCSVNGIFKPIRYGTFPDEGRGFGNENQPYAETCIPEDNSTHDEGEMVSIHLDNCLPATKLEYEQYLLEKE